VKTCDIHLGRIYTNGITEREVIAETADGQRVTWCPAIVERDAAGRYVTRAMILAQCATWKKSHFAVWAIAVLEASEEPQIVNSQS
jgi:hypothetical protein